MVAINRRIEKVILWQNGMVMVFDQNGDQMPAFQGHVDDVRTKIESVYQGEWERLNYHEPRIAWHDAFQMFIKK